MRSAKEVLQEAVKPVLSIFVRMTIDQITAVSLNTGLAERRRRVFSPLTQLTVSSLQDLQAAEGNAVVNEIRESQEAEDGLCLMFS